MSNTVSTANLRKKLWQEELYKDVMDNLYFQSNGLMGEGENNIIQVKSDLAKSKGDTIYLPLTAKLSGNGVSGDSELEGNEEAISAYEETVAIDQKRFAVRLTGTLDEQKNAYNMRSDAKNKLSARMQEFLERQFFLKLGGVVNAALTDVNGNVIAADCAWSNTPDYIPDADEAGTGTMKRFISANASGDDALAATDLMTPALISKAKVKAQLCSPQIRPLKIDGRNHYVMFLHPYQAMDLKNNAVFAQAMREAEVRGKSNPIFTGALGVWDGVILYEHEYVPFLDVSVVGHNFRAAAAGTDIAVDCFRALLCGCQAGVFAQCKNPKGWIEKTFDYENQTGFATGIIGGIQKVMFNSLEYGVIAVDTAATAI